MVKELSRSKSLGAKTMFAALQALKENGGSLPVSHVMEEVKKRITFDKWESEIYEATGAIRWQSIMSFFSIDYVKAGYILKKKGVWYITPEGEENLKLGDVALLDKANALYKKWNLARLQGEGPQAPGETDVPEKEMDQYTIERIEQTAIDGIKNYIAQKNAYEFQDMAAALLRAMGYFTPFVAPRGKDGGVDIQAYRDPLGTVSPRIKVQVKHKQSAASVQEMRQLIGLLQKDGDVGIFISTAGFTPDAVSAARSSHVHVELIDFDRFIALWQEFYQKLSDEDKSLLPLRVVYFIDQLE